MSTLLSVRHLVISFPSAPRAVDGISLDVAKGSTVALVGESGCGKTVAALAMIRLLPPAGKVERGEIVFGGRDLLALPEEAMISLRGKKIAMISQEPMASLNPVHTIGSQLIELIAVHQEKSRSEARQEALAMLKSLGIASPETNVDAYPHQLSSGMRQRVLIALALACQPDLLIADEPAALVDVTTRTHILDFLRRKQESLGMSILLVTSDLGIVAETASRMAVVYAGRIVEEGPVRELFQAPKHPYTECLVKTLRRAGESRARGSATRPVRLPTIEGASPDPMSLPRGCKFESGCTYREARCRNEEPLLIALDAERSSRCFFTERVGTTP